MLSFTLSGNIKKVTTNNNNRRHNLSTFTFPYAYNEAYSYVTSNSYNIIHVDFILFRFHIIILFVLLPCVISFTSFNSYLLHVWHVRSYSKQTYTYKRQIGTYQSHIKYIQGQIKWIHRLIHLVIVLLNFSFSKVSRPESPTQPGWQIQAGARFTPTFSIIISKHFVWFYYSILDFLNTRKHFILAIP